MKHDILDIELFLHKNAVFSFVEPTRKEARKLRRNKIAEFVVTMSPVTRIESRREMDALIRNLQA